MCSRIMEERFARIPKSHLAVAVLLVSTAPSVEDIASLIKRLLYRVEPYTEMKIMESFYFLLTHLQLFRDEFGLPWRPGYLLLHGLSLQQRSWTAQVIGPTGDTKRSLTAEQSRIINMDLESLNYKDIVRIMAYAGTGKTTTLIELTRRHPNIKFFLVVFNKSVEQHSKRVFPSNVLVKTAHSLSWQFITSTEGHDTFRGWNYNASDLISNHLIPKRKEEKPYTPFNLFHWAGMIIDSINSFFNSADSSPSLEHVPSSWPLHPDVVRLSERHRQFLLEDSKQIWRKIQDPNFRTLKFDHNSSMKMFQLSKPDLKGYVSHYDVLLLDEAQDMNPCMLSVCLSQKVPKILVGDNFQQIYGFRGAVNALEIVDNFQDCQVKETFYLSQSFRFGSEIAFAAECCLKYLLGARGPSIMGTSKRDSVTGYINGQDTSVQHNQKTAVIGRSNSGVFAEMVKLVCEVEKHQRPKIAFPTNRGESEVKGWKKLVEMSLHRSGKTELLQGKSRDNPTYKKNWVTFVSETRDSNDTEMIGKINIVEKFREKIPEYVDILKEQIVHIEDPGPILVFTTVHKFKGLEMEVVRLLDDFYYEGIPHTKPDLTLHSREAFNLLYVALTRAKSLVIMNDALYFLLTSSAVDSCYEILKEPPLQPSACVLCLQQTDQYQTPAVLWQRPLVILNTIRRRSGYLCSTCAWADRRKVYDCVGSGKEVSAGTSLAGYHSWLRTIVSPREYSPQMGAFYQSTVLDNRHHWDYHLPPVLPPVPLPSVFC